MRKIVISAVTIIMLLTIGGSVYIANGNSTENTELTITYSNYNLNKLFENSESDTFEVLSASDDTIVFKRYIESASTYKIEIYAYDVISKELTNLEELQSDDQLDIMYTRNNIVYFYKKTSNIDQTFELFSLENGKTSSLYKVESKLINLSHVEIINGELTLFIEKTDNEDKKSLNIVNVDKSL